MSFTIKEASERLGCPAHKIRYYEKEGLLPYINRDQNGNRLFEEEHLEWMRVMSCFRATGMKVSVLKQMVNLAMEGASTIPLRKAMLTQYKKELHQRQNDLNQALEAVNQKLSIYDDMEKGKEDSENRLLQEMSSLKHI
ncbi:MerR family transcriptional regulator [Paenibacillus illinoisensis]|uniref:MerR family transcriptional regulator n=1 Tax=Paenibacillus illinoisensis TaxID=59845 RepID=UPI00301E38E4